MVALVFGKVQRSAAMGKPAHDQPIAVDELLAVNTQILSAFERPAGDHQPPSNERGNVARPAVLDGQPGQVDLYPFPTSSWHGARLTRFGPISSARRSSGVFPKRRASARALAL